MRIATANESIALATIRLLVAAKKHVTSGASRTSGVEIAWIPASHMGYDLVGIAQESMKAVYVQPRTTLGDLSDHFRVERHTIERAIRMRFGTSFRDLKRDVTIRKALRLMASRPASTMTELAAELGFHSCREFCRFFRKACSMSPTDFRQKLDAESRAIILSEPVICVDENFTEG